MLLSLISNQLRLIKVDKFVKMLMSSIRLEISKLLLNILIYLAFAKIKNIRKIN